MLTTLGVIYEQGRAVKKILKNQFNIFLKQLKEEILTLIIEFPYITLLEMVK